MTKGKDENPPFVENFDKTYLSAKPRLGSHEQLFLGFSGLIMLMTLLGSVPLAKPWYSVKCSFNEFDVSPTYLSRTHA